VLLGLAELDPKAMVDQAALAELLGVSSRTIRQMVKRFEIPPPIRLNSRSVWFVGKVLEHLEARAKLAQDKADKEAKKYKTDFF
jgi:predicted DNA-binding transcriptional regulator AlpA